MVTGDLKAKLPSLGITSAFGAIYFLWGGTYLAIAVGLQSIPAFLLMGLRSVIGGLVLLFFSWLWGSRRSSLADWMHAAISGALLFVGCHGALAYAQHDIPSGLSAVVLATIPFWIVLINFVIDRKEPPLKFIGLIPGFAGVGLIGWRETSKSEDPLPLAMIVLLLAAALSWALGSVYSQRRAGHIPSHDLSGMQLLCGGTVLLMLSYAMEEWDGFLRGEISTASMIGLLYLGLLGSVVGNTAYLWLLERMSAPAVATYTFVNPVIALALGWWVLGETITITSLCGSALVVSSIMSLLWLQMREETARS